MHSRKDLKELRADGISKSQDSVVFKADGF